MDASVVGMSVLPRDRAVEALAAWGRARGVSFKVSRDWSGLEAVNAENRGSWFELMPKPRSAPALWVSAVALNGQVAGTYAVYMLDCRTLSFGDRLADLSAFHDDPPADEWSFCASEVAHDTRGLVAFTVAGWVRPDWRGAGLFHRIGLMARLMSWREWNPLWWAGLVDPEAVSVWRTKGAGRCHLESRPSTIYFQRGVGQIRSHCLRISRQSMIHSIVSLGVGYEVTQDSTALRPAPSAQPIKVCVNG